MQQNYIEEQHANKKDELEFARFLAQNFIRKYYLAVSFNFWYNARI